jgi:hypothetical protein
VGRGVTFLALSVAVVCVGVFGRMAYEEVTVPEPAQAQDTGTCPSAQLIDTFEGNGDQQTDTFDTTTDSFRVSFETTNTAGSGFEGSLFVDVINADRPNDLPVASLSQEGSGTGETFANAPPGTYYLDVIAGGLDYTLTVEQCEGGDPSRNPGGGASPSPDPQPAPAPPQSRRVVLATGAACSDRAVPNSGRCRSCRTAAA